MYFFISIYMFFFALFLLMIFLMILIKKLNLFIYWTIMTLNSSNMEFIIYIDYIMCIFFFVILFITSMILIYSMEYMINDFFLNRFMLLIIIFMFSMLFMIISPNMLSILLGWDGLGLSSYCLIMYYQNMKSLNSSTITILMNRIGDIFLIISSSLMIKYGSWNMMFFKEMNSFMYLFIIFIFITKSAQLPFMSWLPMAMAAPTPVSALVHSSTLVTAGVYLMLRFLNLLNNNFLNIMLLLSLLTMLYAGVSALFEFDLKKIIAYSTLSQLSLMFMTLSLKMKEITFFHLINHAMFKSMMFLCAGIIIHNYFNIQDIRNLNMIYLNMPIVSIILNFSIFSLMGIPFLTGFYSKDLMIEMFLMSKNNLFTMILMFKCMMLTFLYSIRMIYYLNMKKITNIYMNIYNLNNLMNKSIYFLFIMTIIFGSLMNMIMFNSIYLINLSLNNKMLIYLILLFSFILFFLFIYQKMKTNSMMLLYMFFNSLWFFNNQMKNMKLNLLNFNNMNYFNENLWIEYFSSKKLIYLFMNMLKKN
uniref:NADH:ubiquinone reductase (H(+)-translocating) n=1 Tax=Pselaphanus sp. QL-2013 TaxID=1421598 RepID=A0A0A6ZL86_9HYME|nr:NADH dehydrogenase subunit 5 [Pselaphanus sp. QL-2013]